MNPQSHRIKVVHIITRFDKGGSAENTFLTVCGLDKNRYEVLLITGSPPAGNSADPEARAAQQNVDAARDAGVRMIAIRRLVRDLRPLSDMISFLALLRIIGNERPDIVHTHTSKAGILGRWAALLCRVPVIVHTPHGHVFWGYFGPLKTRLFIWLEKCTAWFTDAIITLTPQEREDHLKLRIAPERKFTVIHSGVDLRKFRADGYGQADTKRGGGVEPATTVIGTAGRLTAIKGQDVLIRAVAELVRRGHDVALVLLGEGELRGELEELARRLGIGDRVHFLGWRSDVAGVMAAFDIFCLPSLNEGMGKVLVEAMAMGKPIAASDIGGIRDIVRPGENGLLVPVGDGAAWVAALTRLARDPEERRRLGEAGRRMAPLYSAEEMIKKIDRLYGNLLAMHR
ncbi:MAG: glycosyltransferase family 4 protein [Syntrophales bacterium]